MTASPRFKVKSDEVFAAVYNLDDCVRTGIMVRQSELDHIARMCSGPALLNASGLDITDPRLIVHVLAIKYYGLPQISGTYGLTSRGEFIAVGIDFDKSQDVNRVRDMVEKGKRQKTYYAPSKPLPSRAEFMQHFEAGRKAGETKRAIDALRRSIER